MKDEEKQYECKECDKRIDVSSTDEIPVCCGREMKSIPLEPCRGVHGEMSRNDMDNEPCDDGRGQGSYNKE